MIQNKKPTVLVTGASGFLGRAIVAQLRAENCDLRTTGRRRTPPADLPNYTSVDLCMSSAATELITGVDIVIHAAGLAHQHRAASLDSDEFVRINAAGAEAVAHAAAGAGCRRFVLVGSVSVYGNGWPAKNESAPCRPSSPYARSKLAAEQAVIQVAAPSAMKAIVLRMTTLYGENDPGNVARLLDAIERHRFIWVGRGTNSKSLLHVEDAASACVAAALNPRPPKNSTYNVSTKPCTMSSIVSALSVALDRRAPSLHLPARPLLLVAAIAQRLPTLSERAKHLRVTIEKWLSDEAYDASAFAKEFGWSPRVSLQAGLERQVSHHLRREVKTFVNDNQHERRRAA
jgi:nucleoside-diphosphate-sugar epimerase